MTYKVKNVDDTTITGHMTKWCQEKKIRSRMLFLEVSFKKKKLLGLGHQRSRKEMGLMKKFCAWNMPVCDVSCEDVFYCSSVKV